MRFSKLLITTFKEVPADAQIISHQLMFRAGLIVKSGSGLYSYSPLMVKAINKLTSIVREELSKKNCLEVVFPMVTPSELWEESNRLHEMGDLLTVFEDRSERTLCLSPTNEEAVVDYFRKIAKSYKQLPTTLYQINTKFRDEIRPRFGLMRAREFTMKDAYSFHINKDCLNQTYQDMYDCYESILKRCNLDYIVVEADGGAIAGSDSQTHEFQVLAENGEDEVVVCKKENYAANVEAAVTKRAKTSFNYSDQTIQKVETPNTTTMESVCSFLNQPLEHALKAMAYTVKKSDKEEIVIALVLGDDSVNEIKVKNVTQADMVTLLSEDEMQQQNLVKGFIGPKNINKKINIILDEAIDPKGVYITGANEKDFHLTGVCPEKDFEYKLADIRSAKANDTTLNGNAVSFVKGIEVGHIFQLGDKYTQLMKASVLDDNGKATFPLMGCYGIGIGRLIAAAIEQHYDDKGIVWPASLAPFKVVIITTSQKDEEIVACAEELYSNLLKSNIDVIFDDRSISVGVKFKDADLIGFPLKVIVGKQFKENKLIEIKKRKNDESFLGSQQEIVAFCQKNES